MQVQSEGKASEIRVRDWFEDFDKLRSGRVSIGVFGRVLDLMKLTLTKEEIDVLVSSYHDPESKQVQYNQFCRDIEEGQSYYFVIEHNSTSHCVELK